MHVHVYAPQSALSLEEAPAPPDAGCLDPVVYEPTDYFTDHNCNLRSSVSPTIYNEMTLGTYHWSGIRASDDIFAVPEPNWRRRTEEDNIGSLLMSRYVRASCEVQLLTFVPILKPKTAA